jgi:hypothetical protein
MVKVALNRKNTPVTSKLDLNLRKKLRSKLAHLEHSIL